VHLVGVSQQFAISRRVAVCDHAYVRSSAELTVDPVVQTTHLLRSAAVQPVKRTSRNSIGMFEPRCENIVNTKQLTERTHVHLERGRHEDHLIPHSLMPTQGFDRVVAKPAVVNSAGKLRTEGPKVVISPISERSLSSECLDLIPISTGEC